MDISELVQLTHWVDKEIKGRQVFEKYNALQQTLQANTRSNQTRQPFEAQRNELFSTIRQISLESLNIQQLAFLECIGIGSNVSIEAILNIEDILFRNAIDAATAAQRISEITNQVAEGIAKSDSIQSSLAVVDTGKLSEIVDGKALVRVTFNKEASISNVVDLKAWSSIWHDIGRGVAMIHDLPPEEIEIVGASRGSVIIDFAVNYAVAITISKIMLDALHITEKIFNIRKTIEEVRGLKLENSAKISKELENQVDKVKTDGVSEISHHVAKLRNKADTKEGDKIAALEIAIKNLIVFLEKGGEIDCVTPDEVDDESIDTAQTKKELKELRVNFREIRQLELNLKQIGNGE